jgi:hypothetical protein
MDFSYLKRDFMRETGNCLRVPGVLIALAVSMVSVSQGAEPVSTESLLGEMSDRTTLARFPSPAYRSLQASSYDRASEDPGTEDWSANRDYSQFLRTEVIAGRTEYVMMHTESPGAIVRIWLTWAGRPRIPFSDGTIRMYLDGATQPVVIAKASEFIDGGPDGEASPFGSEPLAYGVSPKTPHNRRGHNLFVPIPFAKSCKVTYETDQVLAPDGRINESFYFHVGYRVYEPGTKVETFSLDRWKGLIREREAAAERLLGKRGDADLAGPAQETTKNGGKTYERQWRLPAGSHAIRQIRMDASSLSPQALRSTLIVMSFDGQETVRVPLEGFFTCGYRPRPFQTWMHSCSEDKILECRFVMPYSESAVVKLIGADVQPIETPPLEIFTSPWHWDDRSLYFHADWQTDRRLSTGIAKTQDNREGVVDLDFLDAKGRGVLAGDSITLFSGAARWWGEGDEKIYVDGEGFPSHFGTGTEDYYGYAWCRPELFTKPFHAQPVGRGALLGGLVVNTRLRSLDAIPFNTSIDFDMELWHWSATKVNYARTVFWYGDADATSTGQTSHLARAPVALRDTDITPPVKVPNAVEGESARIVEVTGGELVTDRYTLFGWSDGAQLLWKDARPRDRLVLEFDQWPAASSDLIYTIGPDYGEAEIAIGDSSQTIDGQFWGILSVLENRRINFKYRGAGPMRVIITMRGRGNHGRRFGIDAIVPRQ